jgi:hypothetical protein
MLLKSNFGLIQRTNSFFQGCQNVSIFSAYIKLNQLEELNKDKKINRIVVRWEIEDLVKGVSDFEELFTYCKENDIALYRNTRIHLKAIWNNENSVLFGSANITGKGIGEKGNNFNYELAGIVNPISFEDITYFNFIIQSSELVNDDLFLEMKNLVDNIEIPTIEFPKLPTKKKIDDELLISQLPMTCSPEHLIEILKNPNDFPLEEQLKAAHDKVLYDIVIEDGYEITLTKLKDAFNEKIIIQKVKLTIEEAPRKSLKYGDVVNWIQEKTTTVPTPMRWEIKEEQIVNNLYEWICFFDQAFYWDRPRHSQIIYSRN